MNFLYGPLCFCLIFIICPLVFVLLFGLSYITLFSSFHGLPLFFIFLLKLSAISFPVLCDFHDSVSFLYVATQIVLCVSSGFCMTSTHLLVLCVFSVFYVMFMVWFFFNSLHGLSLILMLLFKSSYTSFPVFVKSLRLYLSSLYRCLNCLVCLLPFSCDLHGSAYLVYLF